MDRQKFNSYQKKMRTHLVEMLATRPPHALDEQAVPSYTHGNSVIAHLFWSRVWRIIDYLEDIKIGNVLDFGCGTGILFPFLISRGEGLTAFDVDPSAAQEMAQRLNLYGIRFLSSWKSVEALPSASFDTILALDVLEHVDNLPEVSALFNRLVKPGGRLIVSGPTESSLYKLGRWFAGYKHHFHRRNIYDIEKELSLYFKVQLLAALYPWITFFRISSATPLSRPD